MAGPVIYYRDYIDFIHGRHIAIHSQNVNVLFNILTDKINKILIYIIIK